MQTIIVTGASGNLGRAVVNRFLANGDRAVALVIPGDPVPLDIDNPLFVKRTADLNQEAATGDCIREVIRDFGSVDAAVLTAGGFAMGGVVDSSSDDILRQYRLNFETAYHVARPVFTHMLEKGSGRIFLIGSRPGSDMRNSKGMVAYGLSKSLIFRLAELMNADAAGTDVVASVVVPSTIDTPANRKSMPDADFSKWVKPEDIAEIIRFHCSPAAAVLREPVIKVYGRS